jgi:serine/threonine-protein kinase RsbW
LVIDQGNGFNPTQLPDPLDPSNLLNPNGRGIFYMRTFMDEVEYTSGNHGGTVVRMTKFRQKS